jgi:hypothetical protein
MTDGLMLGPRCRIDPPGTPHRLGKSRDTSSNSVTLSDFVQTPTRP